MWDEGALNLFSPTVRVIKPVSGSYEPPVGENDVLNALPTNTLIVLSVLPNICNHALFAGSSSLGYEWVE